jgi:hypothetical protein
VYLPQPTAERSLIAAAPRFPGQPTRTQAPGINPQFDALCLLRCAGNALSCIACGVNIPCWAACAGPQAVDCISRCF